MTDFKAKMHSAGAPPQTPLGELTALPRPPSWIWGPLRGRGGAGLGKRRERRGREREGPKLLLNQGPSEPCYATEHGMLITVVTV